MSYIPWQERITVDPNLHHGAPCIRGTRIPITTIVGSLADRMTPGDIQAAYPQLTLEDIYAALAYALEVLKQETFLPFTVLGAHNAHQGGRGSAQDGSPDAS